MSNRQATYDILIAIRDKLDGLEKALSGLKTAGKAVDEVNEKAGALSKTFKAVFGANLAERALGSFVGAAKQAATAAFTLASEIKDGAVNLEMSMRGFQVYKQLVQDTGGSWGSFTMAVTHMNRALIDSQDTTSAAAAAFEALDLDPVKVRAMDTEHRFEALATAIAKMEDQEAALNATSVIFGERTLPRLRGAIKDLAENGYDRLASSMEDSDRILDDAEIARLDAASKKVERGILAATRMAGGAEARLLGVAMDDVRADTPAKRASEQQLRALANQRATLQALRDAFEDTARAQALFEGDPSRTDEQKRRSRIQHLRDEQRVLQQMVALLDPRQAGSLPIDSAAGETLEKRTKMIGQLLEQQRAMANEEQTLLGRNADRKNLRDRARGVNNPAINRGALTIGEGVQDGLLRWVADLGSNGEQVASVIHDGIGGALSAVSAKLGGGDVRSWGDVWRGVLQGLLQNLIQVTLQMQLMRAIMGIFAPSGDVAIGQSQSMGILNGGFNPLAGAKPFTIPGRATGGDVEAGRLYSVNEHRAPEFFIPRVSGRITSSAMRSGRGRELAVGDIHLHVSTGIQDTVRAEMVQLMPAIRAMIPGALQEAIARNQLEG